MSYSFLLFLIDIGIIGTITALIVAVTVVLARREDEHAPDPVVAPHIQHARSRSAF